MHRPCLGGIIAIAFLRPIHRHFLITQGGQRELEVVLMVRRIRQIRSVLRGGSLVLEIAGTGNTPILLCLRAGLRTETQFITRLLAVERSGINNRINLIPFGGDVRGQSLRIRRVVLGCTFTIRDVIIRLGVKIPFSHLAKLRFIKRHSLGLVTCTDHRCEQHSCQEKRKNPFHKIID